MSRIMQTDTTNIGSMHLLVINGEGNVRYETYNYFKVQAGDAVYWGKEE